IALIAGHSSNVTLRLKGKLDEFQFPDGKGGVFQVTARVSDGVLHYADGWPDIGNIAGDVVFRGQRMEVNAWQGAIFGVRLSKVRAEIPDLAHENEVLSVSGDAEGPTSDFFAFIEKSPVAGFTDHFTRGWQAQGTGRLALTLSIPLRDAAKSTVAGAYQFANNTVTISPELPVMEQAGGRVDFTETTVRMQNVKGVVLGGPVTISASAARDAGMRVSFQGRINADIARRAGGPQWLRNLRGATDWRGSLTDRKGSGADFVIESNLQGLAVNLPAPLMKAAAEALPVRIERRSLAAGQDRLSLSVGDILGMNLLRRIEGEQATITRGSVRFGGVAADSDRDGVWASGTVKMLDLDRWLDLLGQEGGGTRVEWGGIDLKLGALDVLGWRFSDLSVKASVQNGQWRTTLAGKEVNGDATWDPQGSGKLVARMKTFAIPPAVPGAEQTASREPQTRTEPRELPALDVVAEQFIVKDRLLGRLEAAAVPQGGDWRLERLLLTNPESNLKLDGVWQFAPARPLTQINLRLEASDIGKLLTRLGQPEGVRRGTAKLEGSLSWNGSPYELDYPTMTGTLALEAAKGQF
ncbi:MAG: YhdP family protein, partial [Burkholderiales bacterium]